MARLAVALLLVALTLRTYPLAVGLGMAEPRAAYVFTWIVVIGSLAWLAAAAASKARRSWWIDLASLLAAVPLLVLFFPFLPGVFMADGFKSIAILAGIWAVILLEVFPAVEGAVARVRGAAAAWPPMPG
jgi:hypothetical protein